MITRLTNFGNVGNVGHINTINIGGVEITIELESIERMDQSLAMEHPINIHLCMPQKTLKYQVMNCIAHNTHNTTSIKPFTQHPQLLEMRVCLGSYPSKVRPMNPI